MSNPQQLADPFLGPRKAARVRVREKGSGKEGHVYQGQDIVIPCEGCGGGNAVAPTLAQGRGKK